MRVFFDARLAARGLGIASATERLVEAFKQLPDISLEVNATTHGWTRKGQWDTLLRTGMLDVRASLDPRTSGADIVHYFGNTAPWLGDRNTLVTVHDLMMLRQSSLKARVYERLLLPGLLRPDQLLTAISSRTADAVMKLGVPAGRIAVVPHGRRVDRRVPPRDERMHIMMFGGSSDPRKRVDLGLMAYRRYAERAGLGALPLVIAARSGLSADHRRLLDGLPVSVEQDPDGAEVARMVEGAACLIFPSTWEGFGLPLVEAGEAGTPVVMDNQADVPPEAIGVHVNAVEGPDPSDWASAIARAVDLAPVADAIRHLPTWKQVAERYATLYAEVGAR